MKRGPTKDTKSTKDPLDGLTGRELRSVANVIRGMLLEMDMDDCWRAWFRGGVAALAASVLETLRQKPETRNLKPSKGGSQ